MKTRIERSVSILLIIVMITAQLGTLAESSEDKGGFFGAAGDFFGNAWAGVESAAGDAANWATGAAEDVGHWFEGAYNDTIQWAGNAAIWAGDTASLAGQWLAGTATGAWDWTKGAANDTWVWARATAENAWNVTSKTVGGTWESVFGKADNIEGPHHLCVSSPLLAQAKNLESRNDGTGIITECFTYDDDYDITLIATPRAEEIMPPSVGDILFSDLDHIS